MKLLSSLNKPYSEEQKQNFIEEFQVGTNIIQETHKALEAWAYTEEDEVVPYIPEPEPETLEEVKARKQTENTNKAQQAIQNGYVVFKNAQFETNTQTCSDLTSTMLLMQASGVETYNWLSRDDKVVTLTLEDFGTLGGLIAMYKDTVWNTKYVGFKQQIEEAETIEEVKAIVIDYDVPTMLESLQN